MSQTGGTLTLHVLTAQVVHIHIYPFFNLDDVWEYAVNLVYCMLLGGC